jgi:hypothetical protein
VTPASDEIRPAKRKVLSLPLDLWPDTDRTAWNSACRPAARLRPGGAVSHLRPVTRDDLARRYARFLGFLDRRGLLRLDEPAAANVTVDNVVAYIAELKDRVSSVTVYGSIYKLRRATQFIDPKRDITWLVEIERDLAVEMRPRSKFDRIVRTEVLVEAGLTLINEAESSPKMNELARWHKIGRIRVACRVRPSLEFDGGQTDEGDPWCVVYDRQRDQVVMHMARIGSGFIIASPNQSKLQKPATPQAAVNAVLRIIAREIRRRDHLAVPPPRTLVSSRDCGGVPHRGAAVRVRLRLSRKVGE